MSCRTTPRGGSIRWERATRRWWCQEPRLATSFRVANIDSICIGGSCLSGVDDDDGDCAMYRHWSLFEAMRYSNYMSTKLRVWKSQGELKLQVRAVLDELLLDRLCLLVLTFWVLCFHMVSNRKC